MLLGGIATIFSRLCSNRTHDVVFLLVAEEGWDETRCQNIIDQLQESFFRNLNELMLNLQYSPLVLNSLYLRRTEHKNSFLSIHPDFIIKQFKIFAELVLAISPA